MYIEFDINDPDWKELQRLATKPSHGNDQLFAKLICKIAWALRRETNQQREDRILPGAGQSEQRP